MKMNHHYEEISQSYLFSTVAKKAADFQKKYPDREMIKLSIGDVTLPLAGAVIKALHGAVDEPFCRKPLPSTMPAMACS